jgi:hypothetical protein
MNGLPAHQVHREILDRVDVLKELVVKLPIPATSRNKPPKSIDRPPAINLNEIMSISRQISEVEGTLRQFRLLNDKKSHAVPDPSMAPSSARKQLKQARKVLDYLARKVFDFMTVVSR